VLRLDHYPIIKSEKSKEAVEHHYSDVGYGAFLNEIMAIGEVKIHFRFSLQSSSQGTLELLLICPIIHCRCFYERVKVCFNGLLYMS
jgi:hypothetical protein